MAEDRQMFENRFVVYNRHFLDFIDNLRRDEIDVVFKRYEKIPDFDAPTVPSAFQYVGADLKERVYFTYLDDPAFPKDLKDKLMKIARFIENIIEERAIPSYEGVIYSHDPCPPDNLFTKSFSMSDDYEDHDGLRTKKCYEGWMESILRYPTGTPITGSFDWLNYTEDPVDELDEARPIRGFYSFEASADQGIELKFSGNTIPTARFLLGKEITVPMSECETNLLTEKIRRMLDPLVQRGYQLEIKG